MAPKKKLADRRAALATLIKKREAASKQLAALAKKLNKAKAEAAKSAAENVDTLYAWMNQVHERWIDHTVTREELESIFITFTSYPTSLASLIRDEECQHLPVVLNALDFLDNAHEIASDILSELACRLNLSGGLIEVSGKHCRKVLIADPGTFLDSKDGRWPDCLDNKPGAIPADDYRHIKDADVVLRQLRQQLKAGSAAVVRLFKEEGAGGDSVKRPSQADPRAIASLPHALTSAYKTLCDVLSSRQHDSNAIREEISGFVHELRKVPAWSAELNRRTTFIESGCGDGSPWKKAADEALGLLPDTLKSDDADFLRSMTRTSIGGVKQLTGIIQSLEGVLGSGGLPDPMQSALETWRRQSVDLYDEAKSINATGCWFLSRAYDDWKGDYTAQSGTLHVLQSTEFGNGLFPLVREAADALLPWAADHPVGVPAAGQPDGRDGELAKTIEWSKPISKKDLFTMLGISRNTLNTRLITGAEPVAGQIRYQAPERARKIQVAVCDLPADLQKRFRKGSKQ